MKANHFIMLGRDCPRQHSAQIQKSQNIQSHLSLIKGYFKMITAKGL